MWAEKKTVEVDWITWLNVLSIIEHSKTFFFLFLRKTSVQTLIVQIRYLLTQLLTQDEVTVKGSSNRLLPWLKLHVSGTEEVWHLSTHRQQLPKKLHERHAAAHWDSETFQKLQVVQFCDMTRARSSDGHIHKILYTCVHHLRTDLW